MLHQSCPSSKQFEPPDMPPQHNAVEKIISAAFCRKEVCTHKDDETPTKCRAIWVPTHDKVHHNKPCERVRFRGIPAGELKKFYL